MLTIPRKSHIIARFTMLIFLFILFSFTTSLADSLPDQPHYHYLIVTKFSQTGTLSWAVQSLQATVNELANPPSYCFIRIYYILVDEDGNIYVSLSNYRGATLYQSKIFKYLPDSTENWSASNLSQVFKKMDMDSFNNIFTLGYYDSLNESRIYKVNKNGDWIWAKKCLFDDKNIQVNDFTLFDYGNYIVTGGVNIEGNVKCVTVKYDSDGNEIWNATYDGPDSGEDVANSITNDSQGNVYITGKSWSDATGFDFLTIKYNSDGEEQWNVRSFNDESEINDEAQAIKTDEEGNVYVTGITCPDKSCGFFTVKYDNDGNEFWKHFYDSENNITATKLLVDDEGNVYVHGVSSESTADTIKYDADGNVEWFVSDEKYGLERPYFDIDTDGNIVVLAGSEFGYIKYDTEGNKISDVEYTDEEVFNLFAHALAVDNDGNVILSGVCEEIGDVINPSPEDDDGDDDDGCGGCTVSTSASSTPIYLTFFMLLIGFIFLVPRLFLGRHT